MHINLIIINHKHVCPNSKSVWIQERELPSNIIIVHQSRWGRDILRMNCFHFMGGNTSIKNGSRHRVNLVGLWSLGLVPMPVSCEILTVSDSDGEGNGESVRKDCQLRSRKRSKHKQKRRLVNPIDQETRLRCILGRPASRQSLDSALSQARKNEQENFPAFQKFSFNSLSLEKIDRRILPQTFRNLCVAFILAVVMTSHLFRNLIPKSCP